jgi:hypothetical protein
VIGLPPFDAGGDHASETEPLPGTAVGCDGAPGGPTTCTAADAGLNSLVPAAFVAASRNR